jgi:putative FmdB family regulatory protein
MPTYSYECEKCQTRVSELRSYSDRHEKVRCVCGGDMVHVIGGMPAVHENELGGKEFMQYWVSDPKAPGGMRIFPHKNKYVSGGYDSGPKS